MEPKPRPKVFTHYTYVFFVPKKKRQEFIDYMKSIRIRVQYEGYSGINHYYEVVSKVTTEKLDLIEMDLDDGRKTRPQCKWYPQQYFQDRIDQALHIKQKIYAH